MDNPEKLATLDTQGTGRRQKQTKKKPTESCHSGVNDKQLFSISEH
jgi:hypothetical protein